jgi:hypothetical protein
MSAILAADGRMAEPASDHRRAIIGNAAQQAALRQLRVMTGKLPDGGDGADHRQHVD